MSIKSNKMMDLLLKLRIVVFIIDIVWILICLEKSNLTFPLC